MVKQTKFLCFGGVLSGTMVQEQGDYFFNVENSLNMALGNTPSEQPVRLKYRKLKIKHPDSIIDYYYVCETTTDQEAKKRVFDIQDAI